MHVAASIGWDIQQFDIKTAFLHGVLPEEETAYLEQRNLFNKRGKAQEVQQAIGVGAPPRGS